MFSEGGAWIGVRSWDFCQIIWYELKIVCHSPITSPSSYSCQSVGQWLSDWVIDSFRFEDSYRISELCKLVHLKFISALHYPLQNFEKMQFLLFAIHTRFDISKFDPCYFSFVLFKNYKKIYLLGAKYAFIATTFYILHRRKKTLH